MAPSRSSSGFPCLEGGFGDEEQEEDEGFGGEHAEGGLLAVPVFGLPHEEPLSADGGEGEEPEHDASGEGECSGV